MGINFSHGEASWSYGGFHRFRTELAKKIGIDLLEMEGFKGYKSWDTVENDLKLFLNHSDGDGELSPLECEKIAPEMKAIIVNWATNDYDRIQAEMLIKGMEQATRSNEPLEFK